MFDKKYLIIGVVALIGGYAIGYGNKPKPDVQIKEVVTIDKEKTEKIIAEEKEKLKREYESKKWQKKTTTRVTKPNGEVEETTSEESKTSEKEKEKKQKEKKESKETKEKENLKKETEITEKYNQSKYSVGFSVQKPIDKVLSTLPSEDLDYLVNAGIRIYGPLWLESGFQVKEKAVSLGIKLEF